MELNKLEQSFKLNNFNTEDDVKIHFHSDIIKPLLEELNPTMVSQYKSEDNLLAGGRTDATFQNVLKMPVESKKLCMVEIIKIMDCMIIL